MALISHIVIALGSIVYATYLLVQPSQTKLNVTYYLVGATLASGTYLVVSQSANLVQACMSGLVYLAAVSLEILLARRKLVSEKVSIDQK
jgi:hypothetical protein